MFKNLFIFCFILSISFIGIHSEENEELLSKLTIIKVSGELKEHQRQQIISLSFIPPIKLNPKNLTDLELKKEGKSYNPETKCFESEVTSKRTLIKCKLDLSDISYGTYEINSFNYKKNTGDRHKKRGQTCFTRRVYKKSIFERTYRSDKSRSYHGRYKCGQRSCSQGFNKAFKRRYI